MLRFCYIIIKIYLKTSVLQNSWNLNTVSRYYVQHIVLFSDIAPIQFIR
jgi:hypothetical protein